MEHYSMYIYIYIYYFKHETQFVVPVFKHRLSESNNRKCRQTISYSVTQSFPSVVQHLAIRHTHLPKETPPI